MSKAAIITAFVLVLIIAGIVMLEKPSQTPPKIAGTLVGLASSTPPGTH